jgi:hypothetical protein
MEARQFFLIAALAVTAVPSRAAMIALYTAPGDTLGIEDAADVLRGAREGGHVPARYTVLSSDSAVLTARFSVPEGASAYFWSDETYRHAGFSMRGTYARFDGGPTSISDGEAVAKEAPAPEIIWTTNLGAVALGARELRLGYSLAEEGRVAVEAFGLNGRSWGKWSWRDAAAGMHERKFTLRRAPEGPLWVRWTFGDVSVLRAVSPETKR